MRGLAQKKDLLTDKFVRGRGIDQQTYLDQCSKIDDDRLHTLFGVG